MGELVRFMATWLWCFHGNSIADKNWMYVLDGVWSFIFFHVLDHSRSFHQYLSFCHREFKMIGFSPDFVHQTNRTLWWDCSEVHKSYRGILIPRKRWMEKQNKIGRNPPSNRIESNPSLTSSMCLPRSCFFPHTSFDTFHHGQQRFLFSFNKLLTMIIARSYSY